MSAVSSFCLLIYGQRVGNVIGKGAAGTVWKAINTVTGDFVAIKQIPLQNVESEQDLDAIQSEVKLLEGLNHPNIVKYIDTIRSKDCLSIILEFVENGSLQSLVKKFGRLPESLVSLYVAQTLNGLVYLHAQGVIHRDIKGANILVANRNGHVKLTDFGVATRVSDRKRDAAANEDVAGTPYWMAPEIIDLSGCSPESDIWSLGCTIIELLTGSPPYFDLAPFPALFRIVQDDHPPLPPGISPSLKDFLMSTFQKDPNRRAKADQLLLHPWLRTRGRSQASLTVVQPGCSRRAPRAMAATSPGAWGAQPEGPAFDPEAEAARFAQMRSRVAVAPPPAATAQPAQHKPRAAPGGQDLLKRYQEHDDDDGSTLGRPYPPPLPTTPRFHPHHPALLLHCCLTIPAAAGTPPPLELDLDGDFDLPAPPAGGPAVSAGTQPTKLAAGGGAFAAGLLPGRVGLAPPTLHGPPTSAGGWREGSSGGLAGSGSLTKSDILKHFSEDSQGTIRAVKAAQATDDGEDDIGIDLRGIDINAVRDRITQPAPAAVVPVTDFRESDWVLPESAVDEEAAELERLRDERDAEERERLQRYIHQLDVYATLLQQERHVASGGSTRLPGSPPSISPMRTPIPSPPPPRPPAPVEEDEADEATSGDEEAAHGRGKEPADPALAGMTEQEVREYKAVETCGKMTELIHERASWLIENHGLLPLLELLDHPSARVREAVLKVINSAIADSHQMQETACFVGMVPAIMSLASPALPVNVRAQVGRFVQNMIHGTEQTLQMFVACRALPNLVQLLEGDYAVNRDLIWGAVANIWHIFNHAPQVRLDQESTALPKQDLCRIFCKSDLLDRLATLLTAVWGECDRVLDDISNIFLYFANNDKTVSIFLCHEDVLRLRLVTALKHLTMNSDALYLLEGRYFKIGDAKVETPSAPAAKNSSVVPPAAPWPTPWPPPGHPLATLTVSVVLLMVVRVRLTRLRPGAASPHQAAQQGAIPHLQRCSQDQTPASELAFECLLSMPHAGPGCRAALWQSEALGFFLRQLDASNKQLKIYEALQAWVAVEPERVGGFLAQPANLGLLLAPLHRPGYIDRLDKILDNVNKITGSSEAINAAMGASPFWGKLAEFLAHANTAVRLSVLRIMRQLYEKCSRPKEVISRYRLYEVIKALSNDEGVLIRKLAGEMLQAFEANDVL
ncbi:putative Serine/threonine-protein kinase sepA [Paratrimastix pyriformis]|uniref:Serine/threonine-protein kinase sepA n=1 Tax=Paratrimastix pyriformis TaxID=342808 RepID=A0ABQ8UH66_9EUKA|nr:putative Serine/threonine-protein kinase sepA [Paratrimastix pyriformis]